MALDATNWAGRRVGSLVRFKRSPREAITVFVIAGVVFLATNKWGPQMEPAANLIGSLIAVYVALPLLEVSWEAFRAPSLKLQADNTDLRSMVGSIQSELDAVNARIAKDQFKIGIETGGYYLAPSDPDHTPPVMAGVWLFYHDIVITNQTDKQLPLELWLQVGLRADGSQRYSDTPRTDIPPWAIHPFMENVKPFGRLLNLPGSHAESGYCATNLTLRALEMAAVTDAKELAETRPYWLEVKNLLTGETTSHAMNFIARNLDMRERQSTSHMASKSL